MNMTYLSPNISFRRPSSQPATGNNSYELHVQTAFCFFIKTKFVSFFSAVKIVNSFICIAVYLENVWINHVLVHTWNIFYS